MKFLVLPDQAWGPLWVMAVATLLVAAAAVLGALAPAIGQRLHAWLVPPANDNEAGFAAPRVRLRGL